MSNQTFITPVELQEANEYIITLKKSSDIEYDKDVITASDKWKKFLKELQTLNK